MIDPVGGSTALSAVRPQPWSSMKDVLSSVASLFGMSDDDLRASLRSGQSLSDIASQKGVSQDQLLSTVTQALQSSSLPPGTDVNSLAQSIVERKGGHHHHHHHHHHDTDATGTQNGTPAGVTEVDSLSVSVTSVDVTA